MFAILVDLDGTIVNSARGIIGSYQHTLRCLGVECPRAEDLTWVVGPPSRRSLPKLLGPDRKVEEAVRRRARESVGASQTLKSLSPRAIEGSPSSHEAINFCSEANLISRGHFASCANSDDNDEKRPMSHSLYRLL